MPAARVCSVPGCPQFAPCPDHKRPGPRQRGYGPEHDKRRARDLRELERNPGRPCPWCGEPMHVSMALDWDHTKQGLTCARCNRADGGRRAHQN